MKMLIAILFLFFTSCTTFSTYSQFSNVEKCEDKSYLCVRNDSLDLNYKSFGGFHFALNLKEYRKIKGAKRPKFKNIIAYGKSNILKGDYYLILNNEIQPANFFYKDTIVYNRKITIALSKSINYDSNKNFLLNFNVNK